MDVLKQLLDPFLKFVGELPKWVQIVVAFVLLAVICYIIYRVVPPPPNQFEAAYQDAQRTLSPAQGPVVVNKTIANLMHLAQTDRQRCDTGNLYMAVAQELPMPSIPQSLVEFLEMHAGDKNSCAVYLAQAANRLQSQATASAGTPGAEHRPAPAPGHPSNAESPRRMTTAAAQIAAATTAVGSQGWVYLGITSDGGKTISADRSIAQTVVPTTPGNDVLVTDDLNLRATSDPHRELGSVVGVIPKGSHVVLTGVPVTVEQRSMSGVASTLIWAPVRLARKAMSLEFGSASSTRPMLVQR